MLNILNLHPLERVAQKQDVSTYSLLFTSVQLVIYLPLIIIKTSSNAMYRLLLIYLQTNSKIIKRTHHKLQPTIYSISKVVLKRTIVNYFQKRMHSYVDLLLIG